MQPDLETGLGAAVTTRSLGIVSLDQAVLDGSGRSEENVVREPIIEIVGLGAHPAGSMPDRQIDPVASLPLEIRIADLESSIPWMRAVVV